MNIKHLLSITADLRNLAAIRHHVEETAITLGIDAGTICDLLLAVDEAVCNIILHGHKGKPESIEIEIEHGGDRLIIRLRDNAPPFDPTRIPPPDLTLPLEQRAVGGLGIHLMRQVMDEVHHRILPQGGNELTLVKRLAVNQ
jgi:serine/threonine-protein kinase RsbW